MNIKRQKKPMVEFGNLSEGDVFLLGDSVYMKTENSYESPEGDFDNAVDLETGNLCRFFPYSCVQPIQCELIIE